MIHQKYHNKGDITSHTNTCIKPPREANYRRRLSEYFELKDIVIFACELAEAEEGLVIQYESIVRKQGIVIKVIESLNENIDSSFSLWEGLEQTQNHKTHVNEMFVQVIYHNCDLGKLKLSRSISHNISNINFYCLKSL